jgi:prevent-host-death family protein
MQTIQISEAERDFPRVLDEVERGETVVITRHGREIARVLPGSGAICEPQTEAEIKIDRERVQRAMDSIREIRKRTKPVSLEEILSARDEGRR